MPYHSSFLYFVRKFFISLSSKLKAPFLDEQLFILQLQKGDDIAFDKLIQLYSSQVLNSSVNILVSREDAEDVCQEVFIEVFRSIKNFKGDSKLSTWIYRITISKSLEFLRRKNRKKRSGFFRELFGSDDQEFNVPADFNHPGVLLENKELAAVLFSALEKLPERQRIAFLLSKTENLSYSEISEVMEISVSSVESLLFRAKQGLQGLLEKYYRKHYK